MTAAKTVRRQHPAWCDAVRCDGDHWHFGERFHVDRTGGRCPTRNPRYGPFVDGKCINCQTEDGPPEIMVGVNIRRATLTNGRGAPTQVVLHCDGTHDDFELDLLPQEAVRLAARLIEAVGLIDGGERP